MTKEGFCVEGSLLTQINHIAVNKIGFNQNMTFSTNIPIYEHDLRDIFRMFAPVFCLPLDIRLNYYDGGGCEVKIGEKTYKYVLFTGGVLKKELKKRLYLSLSDFLGATLPWGSLTGIRPTKIAYKYLYDGGRTENIAKMLQDEYYVSPKKAQLIAKIVKNQTEFLQNIFPNERARTPGVFDGLSGYVNLYVHIPFCPARCSYCSFVSIPREKNETLLKEYIALLCRDIVQTLDLIKRQNKKILSAYVGGGTPTVLNCEEMDALLSAVGSIDEVGEGKEYTVEAGRPDTITAEKLEVLKKHGVTRVCVNPQTFNDKTLAAIERSHDAASVVKAFNLCRDYGFDVNMDLIAGLPGEGVKDFENSLNFAVALKPENLTVHTLSMKKGSKFHGAGIENEKNLLKANVDAQDMVDLAYNTLKNVSYVPYYLYRQKETAQNLENTGYSLAGKFSINNITVMEETVFVYACGAGAISKNVRGGVITRLAELRDVGLYIKEFDKRLAKKLDFLGGGG
ncbi:MAG: coproporphyrinogen dehydrogenase HemZ [Firmicutes bacterium]|nr:coproporphyrinogen dehydrogenase HemZ [Bacillota bacterium]